MKLNKIDKVFLWVLYFIFGIALGCLFWVWIVLERFPAEGGAFHVG